MEVELTRLADEYLDGELDEAGGERLRSLLESDVKSVRLFVRQIYFHQQLRDRMLAENVSRCLEESQLEESLTSNGEPGVESELTTLRGKRLTRYESTSWPWGWVTALLLVSTLVAGVTWRLATSRSSATTVVVAPPTPDSAALWPELQPCVATLVNATNCRWDPSYSTVNLSAGSEMRTGESLHLLEGAAELNMKFINGGVALLQLEGPLAMTLNRRGTPNLLYGHLTCLFNGDFDHFSLDTPLGRVSTSGDGSIGVIAAANKVELHVFSGKASIELWAMGVGRAAEKLVAKSGSSMSFHVDADGKMSVVRGESQESDFLTSAARTANRLPISADYVAAILAAKPLAYWRFEGDVDSVMRNEVSELLSCRMVGNAVRWHPGPDGSTVEFGAATGPGYLITDDTLPMLPDGYSVELWAKPKYYHHATLFSLLDWSAPASPVGKHRMVLEICGPMSWFTSPYRTTDPYPGRVRFVNECRPNFDVDSYSPQPYDVRHWQHIVAVKARSEMRMYLNGSLVDRKEATGVLPAGNRLLMGQLLPESSPPAAVEVTPRLYSGELDEVAFYNRVLSAEEIERHFKLVQPSDQETSDEKPRVELVESQQSL